MEELRQLGRYQLTRVLGRGAMGVVYEGTDPKLNRQIAVKTILKGHISDPDLEAEYSARFIREAQAVARLNHPNIVTVFDFGEENEIAFIVMECIRGDELKTYFDEKRQFSLEEAVRMTGELLDALDYAHENGIVHRDIKPANVMLDGQNRVKLTDFGVARLSDASAERTQAGTMVGTPSYMSPEQIEGSAVGPRSDIFAVGIILYQFLTGEKPFHAAGLWAIQKKIMQDDPVLPSMLNTSLPPAFDAVVLRALAKKPDDRYATARDFKKDLQRALAGQELEDTDSTRLVSSSTRLKTSSNAITPASETSQASRSTTGTTGTRGTPNPVSEATGTAGLEIEFWRSIKDSTDPEEIIAYMKRFPSGVYSELAQRKLARLRGETTSSTASLQPPFAQADDATRLHTTGITSITPDDDDDGATRMVPQSGRSMASGSTLAGNSANATQAGGNQHNTQPPAPNAAPQPPAAASGKNKFLLPGVAVGVLAVAGLAFMLTGKDQPAPVANAPASAGTEVAANTTPAATPTPIPAATPSPAPADDSAKQAAEQAARLEAEKKDAEKKEAEKKEAERKEADRIAQEKRDAAKTPEEKKKLELEAKKKAEELAKKQEEEAARKKAELEAKKLKEEETKKARDELAKKKADEEAKKKLEDEARKKALDEAKAKEAQAAAAAANQVAVAKPAASPAGLRAEAAALEGQGKMRDAIKLYKQAALAGDGEAAKRLGNIYGKGEGGIARDYAESLKWNGIARKLGIDIPVGDKM